MTPVRAHCAHSSRAGTALALTLTLLAGGLFACQDAQALTAREVMAKVNEAYAQDLNKPRKVDIDQTVTISRAGQPDITTTSTHVVYQHGEKARMQTVDSDVSVASLGARRAFSGQAVTRQVWVHDGETTKILFESAPQAALSGQTQVMAQVIDHTQLPESAGKEFRSPLLSEEFHGVFMRADFTVSKSVDGGQGVYSLKLRTPFALNADSKMTDADIRIAGDSLLILSADYTLHQKVEIDGKTDVTVLRTQQEFTTNFNLPVAFAGDLFTLELPEDAEDLTDLYRQKVAGARD